MSVSLEERGALWIEFRSNLINIFNSVNLINQYI